MATEAASSLYSDLPIPPGEHLAEELAERGITAGELAAAIGQSASRVEGIVRGEHPLSAELALQLEAALGISASIWTGLEARYRLGLARAAGAARHVSRLEARGR